MNYFYNGTQLTHLTKGSEWMHFYYDGQGRPAMVDYNGTKYHYLYNLQSDVIGLVDSSGTLVVEYKYNAWGSILGTSTLSTAYSSLASMNPFRYRGYIYDEETWMYYCRARYYYPELQRWISADALLGKIGALFSHNIFCYCGNNPVVSVDDEGKKDIDITERLNKEMEDAYNTIATLNLISPIIACAVFFRNVKSGGKWDIKTRDDWNLVSDNDYFYDGIKLRYDEPGNIMFGYIGAALFKQPFFGAEILRLGAGLYQQYQGNSKDEWSKQFPNYGDDPLDSAAIEYGYLLARHNRYIPLLSSNKVEALSYEIYDTIFRLFHK